MSDQGRLILAAALMAVVLVVSWNLVGSRNRETPQDENRQTEIQEQFQYESEEYVSEMEPEPEQEQIHDIQQISVENERDFEAREILVIIKDDTNEDLVHATISTEGASITGWKLQKYEDLSDEGIQNGEQVEMVAGAWFEKRDEEGSTIRFNINTERDVIVVDDTTEIYLTEANGIERLYRFFPNSYEFDLIEQSNAEGIYLFADAMTVTEADVDTSKYFSAVWLAEKVQKKDGKKIEEILSVGRIQWVGVRSRYFALIAATTDDFRTDGFFTPGGEKSTPGFYITDKEIRLYAGPIQYERLKTFGRDADKLVDFGWPVISWIGQLIYLLSVKILSFVENWGIRIIIISMILKFVLLPLTHKSFTSMRKMQLIQPKMQELQKKYKNDPVKQREAITKLYKEEKVNPLGGCLPMLLQMPIFFALYRVLSGTVELRGAPFILWINDLSKAEILIKFGNSILGLKGIGLLAVMMGIAMFIQQKMTISDPKQKSMTYLMPIFMTWIFMRFPAGLTLYWFVNNLLTIGHQEIIRFRERQEQIENKSAKR